MLPHCKSESGRGWDTSKSIKKRPKVDMNEFSEVVLNSNSRWSYNGELELSTMEVLRHSKLSKLNHWAEYACKQGYWIKQDCSTDLKNATKG